MNFDKYKPVVDDADIEPILQEIEKAKDLKAELESELECVKEKIKELTRKKRMVYNLEGARQVSRFKGDALEEVGLTGHPKAEDVWSKAWDAGHA